MLQILETMGFSIKKIIECGSIEMIYIIIFNSIALRGLRVGSNGTLRSGARIVFDKAVLEIQKLVKTSNKEEVYF